MRQVNIQQMKSVINLLRTPLGFTLVEGDVQVNRSTGKPQKDKSYSAPKKFAHQNFTIYPYIPSRDTDNHKYILVPARTQWFNLNTVHELQKKALPEWFRIKKGILATMNNIKFQKHEDLYKKYRNHIIELARDHYLTQSQARKGLAGDACSIIRIHKFLEKWGLINYIHTKPTHQRKKSQQGAKIIPLSKRKDGFDRDKLIVSRTYGKDDFELLKKITRKFRAICHFCQGITGIVWYEYCEVFSLKQFEDVNTKNFRVIAPTAQTFNYKLTLCASCFLEGNIPAVLCLNDFQKKSIVEKIEEDSGHDSDKKRNNEQNKVADAIQKNKFKINKTAQQLKMNPEHVFTVLMTMPIQKLEKISRIEPQTDAEKQQNSNEAEQYEQKKIITQQKEVVIEKETFEEKIRREVKNLESEERQVYQKFLQAWLMKVNNKLLRLHDWENCIQSQFDSVIRVQKNLIAQRVKSLTKGL